MIETGSNEIGDITWHVKTISETMPILNGGGDTEKLSLYLAGS